MDDFRKTTKCVTKGTLHFGQGTQTSIKVKSQLVFFFVYCFLTFFIYFPCSMWITLKQINASIAFAWGIHFWDNLLNFYNYYYDVIDIVIVKNIELFNFGQNSLCIKLRTIYNFVINYFLTVFCAISELQMLIRRFPPDGSVNGVTI